MVLCAAVRLAVVAGIRLAAAGVFLVGNGGPVGLDPTWVVLAVLGVRDQDATAQV